MLVFIESLFMYNIQRLVKLNLNLFFFVFFQARWEAGRETFVWAHVKPECRETARAFRKTEKTNLRCLTGLDGHLKILFININRSV